MIQMSSDFPYLLPDMEVIDAKETSENANSTTSVADTGSIEIDENGEMVVYDE